MKKTKLNSYVIHFDGEATVEAEDEGVAMERFVELGDYDDLQIVEVYQL